MTEKNYPMVVKPLKEERHVGGEARYQGSSAPGRKPLDFLRTETYVLSDHFNQGAST
jgi:hypothetical protein